MDRSTFDLYLVAENLMVFCNTPDDTFKSDVINSSLYAKLVAAQRSSSREKSWSTYKELVGNLKWTLNSQVVQRSEFIPGSLLDLVVKSSGSALPAHDKKILANAFSQLKRLKSDSSAIEKLIEKMNANSSGATFGTYTELTIVLSDKTVLSLQIAFDTTLPIDIDILSQPLMLPIDDGKPNIYLLHSTLDERQYSLIRDTIVKKLGSQIETGLLPIPRTSA